MRLHRKRVNMWNLTFVGHRRKARGFTLVEIMIVVLIIAVLLSIAVPQFIGARMRAQQRTCMNNLRAIVYAKEMLAGDNHLPEGAPVALTDLWPAYIKTPGAPNCPGGGTYTVNAIGTDPECSINTGDYPHLTP